MGSERTHRNTAFLLATLVAAVLLAGCAGTGTIQPQSFNILILVYPLVAAFGILALAYMLASISGMHHWVPIIGDEAMQVLATGVVAFLLFAAQAGLDKYLVGALFAVDQSVTCPQANGCLIDYAQSVLPLTGPNGLETKFSEVQSATTAVAVEASKGIYCNMLGVGFTLNSCGQLNAFRGSLTTAGFTVTAGLLDIFAQQTILSLAKNYAFTLLIPFGLFFRCFKMSRSAGGALIAIGFGFYTAYPIAIAASTKLLTGMSQPLMAEPSPQPIPIVGTMPHTMDYQPPMPEFQCVGGKNCDSNTDPTSCKNAGCTWSGTCNPYATNNDDPRAQFDNYLNAITDPGTTMYLTYLVLVKTIFLSILSLMLTLGFIRELAGLLGSDIDISTLARIS